jgi:hypothetical protein
VHTDTVSAQLHRLNWLLHARVVEAKLRDLRRAVKAGFDPNEPRVPAGSGRTSGRWTGGGGGGSQLAQNSRAGVVQVRSGSGAAKSLRQRLRRKRDWHWHRRTLKPQFVEYRSWTPIGAQLQASPKRSKAKLQLPKPRLRKRRHVQLNWLALESGPVPLLASQSQREGLAAILAQVNATRSIASVPRRDVILAVKPIRARVRATLCQTTSLRMPEIHQDGRSVSILIALHAADAKAIGYAIAKGFHACHVQSGSRRQTLSCLFAIQPVGKSQTSCQSSWYWPPHLAYLWDA